MTKKYVGVKTGNANLLQINAGNVARAPARMRWEMKVRDPLIKWDLPNDI